MVTGAFQTKCFQQPLAAKEIADIKEVIRLSRDTGVENDMVTVEGFVFLLQLFIERGSKIT